jgi:hypothetical protein
VKTGAFLLGINKKIDEPTSIRKNFLKNKSNLFGITKSISYLCIMEQGQISELQFIVEASKLGLSVSKPIDVNSKYDFIIDNNERLIKIQVKSCSTIDNHGKHNRYRVDVACGNSKNKRPYHEKDFDYFAIHLPVDNIWFIIPLDVVHGKKWLGLYKDLNKDFKYSQHRNAWSFLTLTNK